MSAKDNFNTSKESNNNVLSPEDARRVIMTLRHRILGDLIEADVELDLEKIETRWNISWMGWKFPNQVRRKICLFWRPNSVSTIYAHEPPHVQIRVMNEKDDLLHVGMIRERDDNVIDSEISKASDVYLSSAYNERYSLNAEAS